MTFANYIPAVAEVIWGQAELECEYVHSPHWQKTEGDIGISNSIHNFVDCSIPARGYDRFESFLGCVPCHSFGLTGTRGRAEHSSASDEFDVRSPTLGAFAPGSWIENDDGVFQCEIPLEGFGLFFNLGLGNVLR
jgi:hypothetical protein